MKRTRLALILLMLVLLSTAALSGCSRQAAKPKPPVGGQQTKEEPIAVAERQLAPTFTLKDLFTGADVEFKTDAGGRVRMLNFFSPG